MPLMDKRNQKRTNIRTESGFKRIKPTRSPRVPMVLKRGAGAEAEYVGQIEKEREVYISGLGLFGCNEHEHTKIDTYRGGDFDTVALQSLV